MFPYLFIFSSFSLLGLAIRSRAAQFVVIAGLCLVLILFAGTRDNVGCDYHGYWHRFESFYFVPGIVHYLGLSEPGFHLLNLAVIELGLDYMSLNVAASAIYILCIARFAWLQRDPVLLVTLFFPVMIIQLGMSGLRQALAVGFILIGLVQFTSGKKLATGFWILVAASFHTSAYIFLPVAFLAGVRISTPRLLAALLIMAPVAAFLIGDKLALYSDRYIDEIYGDQSSGGARIRYILLIIPAIFFEIYRKKMEFYFPKTYKLMRLYSLMTFALLPVAILSSFALHRFIYYVMPVSLLITANLPYVIFKPSQAKLGRVLPLLLYVVYLVGWFSTSKHADACYVPYNSHIIESSDEFLYQ